MLSEEELQEKWEKLTFTDNFIFSHVMHDENICRQVVELILGVRIGKIHYLSAQDEHKTDPDSMRIIMDVFLRDENRIITVEMQTGHKKELPRRSRYYQSVADVSTTPTSSQYPNLPDNILIFICTFDPFDRNFPRYTFQYTCKEADHQLKLEDGSLRIFLNTATEDLSNLDQKLQAFYHYIQKGVVESELVQNISCKITSLKNDSIVRRFYMTWSITMADMRQEGYEQGISIGLERGLEQGAHQKALETAKAMYLDKVPVETISKYTNLPLDVVQNLIQAQ